MDERHGGWVSKHSPADFARFAVEFRNRLTGGQLTDMASYLYASSDQMHGAMIITADELEQFEEGRKSAFDLLMKMKEGGLITRTTNNYYRYDFLVEVLRTLNLHGLAHDLFVDINEFNEERTPSFPGLDSMFESFTSLPQSFSFGEDLSGGFDPAIFESAKDAEEDKFKCSHCLRVLREPVQNNCGHRYCLGCIRSIASGKTVDDPAKCRRCLSEDSSSVDDPDVDIYDGGGVKSFNSDRAARRDLKKLRVRCINPGCGFKGNLATYVDHSPKCKYGQRTCSGCGLPVPLCELERHRQDYCAARTVACRYCKRGMKASEQQLHEESCDQMLVGCSLCHELVKQSELRSHQMSPGCSHLFVTCAYGCTNEQIKRPDLPTHREEAKLQHANILLGKIKTVGEYISKSPRQRPSLSDDITSPKRAPAPTAGDVPVSVAMAASSLLPGNESIYGESEPHSEFETGRRSTSGHAVMQESLTEDHLNELNRVEDIVLAIAKDANFTENVAARYLLEEQAGVRMNPTYRRPEAAQHSVSDEVQQGASVDGDNQTAVSAHRPALPLDEKFIPIDETINECNRSLAGLSQLMSDVGELSYRLEKVKRKQRGIAKSVKKKQDELEMAVNRKDVIIQDYKMKKEIYLHTSYDGELLWRITGLSQKREDSRTQQVPSLYSHPFYTSRVSGYKMCARLYLNGDGLGRGSHISLFFVVMRGHFDDLLQWPFKQKVQLMLLDLSGQEKHVVDAFRPDPSSTSFRQPQSEMNIASGCPVFCELRKTLDEPNSRYVKDDTIYIRLKVETGGLRE